MPMSMLCYIMLRGGGGGHLALSLNFPEREEEMHIPMPMLCYTMLYHPKLYYYY